MMYSADIRVLKNFVIGAEVRRGPSHQQEHYKIDDTLYENQ